MDISMKHILDYAASSTNNRTAVAMILARVCLATGLFGIWVLWLGPMLSLFDWLKPWHEWFAIVLALSPTMLSMGSVISAIIINKCDKPSTKVDTYASTGLMLSLVGFVFWQILGTLNWPFH